jgi:hypothetical protein
MGARNDGMRNICKLLLNVVNVNRPKMLTGLDQKVRGMVGVVRCCPTRTTIPPANRQTLTHCVKLAEKQGHSPYFSDPRALTCCAALPRDSVLYDVSVRRPIVLPSGFLQTLPHDNALAIG